MTESFDGDFPRHVLDQLNRVGQLTPHMQFFGESEEARVVFDQNSDGFNAYLGYVKGDRRSSVRRFAASTREGVVAEVMGVVFKPERRGGRPFAVRNLLGGNQPTNRV